MSAAVIKAIFRDTYRVIQEHEDELGKLDSVAGDGDHGIGMVRGLRAAQASADAAGPDTDAAAIVSAAGAAFSDAAGGSSGALVGIFIITIGNKLPEYVTTQGVYEVVQLAYERMKKLGKAEPGQKTMLDTLQPFLEMLARTCARPLPEAWAAALPAARAGVEATKAMKSRKGRAARLGDRSLGHADPGAVSMYYLLETVGKVLLEAERNA